jgi:hypothetical protein
VLVAHAYNPSYSGNRDQEDHSSKLAQANSSMRPCLRKTLHKNRAGGVAQGGGHEFKPLVLEKKKSLPQIMSDFMEKSPKKRVSLRVYTLARQALYHLCHFASPFVIFFSR